MKYLFLILLGMGSALSSLGQETVWKHLSTKTGDLEAPNQNQQQTATAVFDVDKDGILDFLIAERTGAPGLVWYKKKPTSWQRFVVHATKIPIEAGSAFADIDGDGDVDAVFGGDSQSNEVWWWENPYPHYDPNTPWHRHPIKASGARKHHDQLFGDFDGDGKLELVFWNQGAQSLYLAEIPENPREGNEWDITAIYQYSGDSQMQPRGRYPGFKGINEHEGLAKADIDGDGIEDILGGGLWFKYQGNNQFLPNPIDPSYTFSRCAAGDLIEGGRPEVVLAVGDGWAPLVLYQWQKGTWIPTILVNEVDCAHSLDILDFNHDGHLDIWFAEMRLQGGNPDAMNMLLLGDGKGHFIQEIISQGIANHESKIADLDGDGDYDILGKPYGWDVPRLDIWLNEGTDSE